MKKTPPTKNGGAYRLQGSTREEKLTPAEATARNALRTDGRQWHPVGSALAALDRMPAAPDPMQEIQTRAAAAVAAGKIVAANATPESGYLQQSARSIWYWLGSQEIHFEQGWRVCEELFVKCSRRAAFKFWTEGRRETGSVPPAKLSPAVQADLIRRACYYDGEGNKHAKPFSAPVCIETSPDIVSANTMAKATALFEEIANQDRTPPAMLA
jgi:hypothetical protein